MTSTRFLICEGEASFTKSKDMINQSSIEEESVYEFRDVTE
jgi:hypothetical protein